MVVCLLARWMVTEGAHAVPWPSPVGVQLAGGQQQQDYILPQQPTNSPWHGRQRSGWARAGPRLG
jgi:hypothetical protein